MSLKKILAISSSRVGNSGYLENAVPLVENFLGSKPTNIGFLPFASAEGDFEVYTSRVKRAFKKLPYFFKTVAPKNAKRIVEESDVLMVGGGNTFKLLHDIYDLEIFDLIKARINTGTPYIGWSAGANITAPTIGTTNDMPVIQPLSFKALGFFSFQINPHYANVATEGFNGETRDQRLNEFLMMNKGARIIGLPEGTALKLSGNQLKFVGTAPGVLLYEEGEPRQFVRKMIEPETDISHLI